MPFKMHKKKFLPEKKKNVFLPYLKFSDPLPETRLIFLFGLIYAFAYYIILCSTLVKLNKLFKHKKASDYDQEIPQSHTVYQPTTLYVRATLDWLHQS